MSNCACHGPVLLPNGKQAPCLYHYYYDKKAKDDKETAKKMRGKK